MINTETDRVWCKQKDPGSPTGERWVAVEFIISLLVGGLVGVIITVLVEEPLKRAQERAVHVLKRLVHRPTYSPRALEVFRFGDLATSWIVLDGDGVSEYTPETIECYYGPNAEDLPPDLTARKKQIQQLEEEKEQQGLPYRWNGRRYSLERFAIERTELEENLCLRLFFRPSDYYTFLATNMSLDDEALSDERSTTLRDEYLHEVDWSKPVNFFANSFGVNIAVVTSDRYLIITQRSESVGSRPGRFSISVNEGLSRDLDRGDQSDAPDMYRCAMRGAIEELGIGLRRSDICFLSFGVDTQYCQWGLLGVARTDQGIDRILRMRGAGVKDKWENSELYPVPFEVDAVVRFIMANGPWASAAPACIYHALVHEFNRTKVDASIAKHSRK